MKIAVLGIDLGKNVCSVVGPGLIRRCGPTSAGPEDTLIDLVGKTAELHCRHGGMCGAHHLGRLFAAQDMTFG